ncbi:MAG: DUF1343 domain-containing protein [Flavobacteriales bacterium]|nr:DUF1343 domain-containing protein [Bacteroidota bacterium]MCB9241839.1 DUF1343 domain-containing protein [Flavobacteriales bacterium]
MHKILLLVPIFFSLVSKGCSPQSVSTQSNEVEVVAEAEPELLTGAQRMNMYLPLLTNKRVAMMVNQTSMIGQTHVVDTLLSIGVNLVRIFAPEHGFRGDHSAGEHVKSTKDEKTGLPIASLYGSTRKPTKEMLKGIDVIIFDIQDVGVRFYTYISSMHYLMEACAENHIKMMVLDRPNPNGFYVDGPVLDLQYKSFIGMHPVPLVHGMTVGEFARMINGERWLSGGDSCALLVVPCGNYQHSTKYQLPVRPSPNLPTMASVYLYPSLGLFEGTVISVGRGTDHPFEVLGRPGLENGTMEFTPRSIPGVADKPKFEGERCSGIQLTEFAKTYLQSYRRVYIDWLYLFYQSRDTTAGDFFLPVFTKLAGTDQLQKQIEANVPKAEVYKSWEPGISAFKPIRKKYLLYPDFE